MLAQDLSDIDRWPDLPYPRIEIIPPDTGKVQCFRVGAIGSVEAARARRALRGSRAILIDGRPPLNITATLDEALQGLDRSGRACDELDLHWLHHPESIRGAEACRQAVYELDRLHRMIFEDDG